jgi:hypothetical protein
MKEETIELLGQRVQVVDLSCPLGPTASEPTSPRVHSVSQQEGAQLWEWMYGIPPTALPAGLFSTSGKLRFLTSPVALEGCSDEGLNLSSRAVTN